MLSNLVVGPEKFVLFIDNNSYEPIAQKLLDRLLNGSPIYHCPKTTDLPLSDTNPSIDIDAELNAVPKKTNVILGNISKLELNWSVSNIVQLVHSLKKCQNLKQTLAWASVKHIQDGKLIPFLHYMADIVITFQDERTLNVLTKRSSGSVFRKEYQYEIGNNFDVVIREKSKTAKKVVQSEPIVDPQSLTTFKINFDENEEIARNALQLPYERNASSAPSKVSQIFYQPDSDDDFDDEDPDEDLNI